MLRDSASVVPLLKLIPDWKNFLKLSTDKELTVLQLHERTGQPLSNAEFAKKMEQSWGEFYIPKADPKKQKKEVKYPVAGTLVPKKGHV